MQVCQHKAKQMFLVGLKWFLFGGLCIFIYYQLSSQFTIDKIVFTERNIGFWGILGCLCFTLINWWLEILKWHILTLSLKLKSFKNSIQEYLIAHAVGVLTPNKIGEFGVKTLFYPKNHRKKILSRKTWASFSQMLATLFFGFLGLLFYILIQSIIPGLSKAQVYFIFGITVVFIFIILVEWRYQFIKKWMQTRLNFTDIIPLPTKRKIVALSFARHLVFSHQFVLVLMLFEVQISYSSAICGIWLVYLLASIIPQFLFSDALTKTGFAVVIFSLYSNQQATIALAVLIMWCLNFVLPTLVGAILNLLHPYKTTE